jgi:aspartate carbamoyltransferase catalytic subunit
LNEHPTQALVDVFSLRRGLDGIRGKTLGFGGDPRGRTVRSLVLLLRHERPAELLFCPPAHVGIPQDVLAIMMEHQIRYRVITDISVALRHCDALMMAPYDMSDIGEAANSGYISPRVTPESHVVTAEKIIACNSETLLYHPLPRQDEIDVSCDDLPNALYFEQVRLSKFMRMAILERALV